MRASRRAVRFEATPLDTKLLNNMIENHEKQEEQDDDDDDDEDDVDVDLSPNQRQLIEKLDSQYGLVSKIQPGQYGLIRQRT